MRNLSKIKPEELKNFKSVMLIGPTDSGKSFFIKDLFNSLLESEKSIIIVDTDTGQSDIGPVGTIGIGTKNKKISVLSELDLVHLSFFGFSSPSEDIASFIMAIRETVMFIRNKKFDKILIDTTGWINGYDAFITKMYKIKLFKPELVILIGKDTHNWKDTIAALGTEIIMCEPSELAIKKDPKKRKINRFRITELFFREKPVFKVEKRKILIKKHTDFDKRLLGIYDSAMNTIGVGWIIKEDEHNVWFRAHIVRSARPAIYKLGAKIEL